MLTVEVRGAPDCRSRYDAADPTDSIDPTAPCAGIAKRLQAETGAGEAAVAPALPGP